MEASVPPLQLAHLVLEGAVLALCVELVVKTIFYVSNQKSWLIRGLKIIMALAMIVKSSLFAAFSSLSLTNHCLLAGRVADAFYHVSCLSAICVLLLRVKVVIPPQKQLLFNIIHAFILISRITVSIFDILYARIWPDKNLGVCRYKDKHQIGVTYTLFDTVFDFYVSIVIIFVLITHIRRLNVNHVGGNINLYKSVVISNAIRTIILSIVNFACTVYYLTANDNPSMVLVLWPISNIFLIMMVGYDTNITSSINQLKVLFSAPLTPDCSSDFVRGHHLNQQHRRTKTISLSSVLNEPILSPPITKEDSPFVLRQLSNITTLEVDDDVDSAKQASGSSNATFNDSSCTIVNVENCPK